MKKCFWFMALFVQWCIGQQKIAPIWSSFASDSINMEQSVSSKNGQKTFLVRFAHPIKREHLRDEGYVLKRFLDPYHAIVSITDTAILKKKKGLSAVPANDWWKVADRLIQDIGNTDSAIPYVTTTDNAERTLALLAKFQDVTIVHRNFNTIYFKASTVSFLSELMAEPTVRYIGKETLKTVPESTVRDLNPSINNIPKIYRDHPELNGNEITVSVKDNKFREGDIDLIDKLTDSPLIAETVDDHATDMATIIAGLGNSSIKGKGIAPGAKLQSSDFSLVSPDPETNLSSAGIFVQNHSYGTAIENFYGSVAAAYDDHTYTHSEELHVFSAGNDGQEIPTDGPYADLGTYGNLTGNFKMAKNTLLVGATNEEGQVVSFSSSGPTYDGRIKPDLVAYSITGTSNATALTSGVAALLLQGYQQWYGETPTAALLKAVLISTADDLNSPGPDHRSGYGAVNAYKALENIRSNRFVTGTVDGGTDQNFTITVPPSTKFLKATLVWTDAPAEVNSNKALVNDLDLTIVDGQNNTYMPWVLRTDPSLSALETAATTGIDRLNNVEQILITDPAPGQMDLRVSGFDISGGPQAFAIAYEVQNNDFFQWNYPVSGDNLPYDGETLSYLRWENSFDQESGILEVSYSNGVDWETIAEEASLEEGFLLWSPPEGLSATGILKMTIGTREYLSDSFQISRAPTINVALDCRDAVEITWNAQEQDDAYEVYNLNGADLELLSTVRDTALVVSVQEIASPYFSIKPVLNDGSSGIRSETIDYRTFGGPCYDASLIANKSEDGTGAALSIALSSLYQVATVAIERQQGDAFVEIGTLETLDARDTTYFDPMPNEGLNRYRIRIDLTDGTAFFSGEADLVFLRTNPFIALPNPISTGITVYSADIPADEVWIEIYDLTGKQVFRKTITEEQEFVVLDQLRTGMYLIKLFTSRGRTSAQLVYKN